MFPWRVARRKAEPEWKVKVGATEGPESKVGTAKSQKVNNMQLVAGKLGAKKRGHWLGVPMPASLLLQQPSTSSPSSSSSSSDVVAAMYNTQRYQQTKC